tara:strand:+ start:4027 stop:4938 length:912 start_codon:yes stop_codon:yes gene_type:complete
MATPRSELYTVEFSDKLALLSQQRMSRLESLVTTGTHVGKSASPVEYTEVGELEQNIGHNQPLTFDDPNHIRRHVLPISYRSKSALISKLDDMRSKLDPTSNYSQQQVNKFNVRKDEVIIDALFADAITGETATGTESFDSNNVIAVGTTDLTVTKVLDGLQILMQNEVDMDDPETVVTMVMTPHQYTTFVKEDEVKNKDFGNSVFDKNDRITKWNGINIVVSNRLLDSAGIRATVNPGASAVREIPLFASSGMHLGIWEDIRGDVCQQPQLDRKPWAVTTYGTFGATRIEEAKVIKIICKET